MAGDLKVIEGSFGISPRDAEENALVASELAKWLQRVGDRKVVAIAICAVAADGDVMTQYVPSEPQNRFSLIGGIYHLLQRVEDNIER